MERLGLDIRPYDNDPGHWGASLATLAEVMVPCLDAAGARSVVEVGAYAGDLTGLLLQWAAPTGARVIAVDPFPQPELEQLAREHEELDLVAETSLDALGRIEIPDAVVLDGDHNYWTVTQELKLAIDRSDGPGAPLVLLHDVSWPHARRDDYYDPETVPEDFRQPMESSIGIFPGVTGVRRGGLPYRWPAAREGGKRNGVLTAVEDFVDSREGLELAVVPAFFGLGVVWHRDASWAEAVAEVVAPWDRNPVVARLEHNRVAHLATSHLRTTELTQARERLARQERVIQRLLDSRAFALAEKLSAMRLKLGFGKGHSQVSRSELRRALDD